MSLTKHFSCLLLTLGLVHVSYLSLAQGGFYSKDLSHQYKPDSEISLYHRVVNFPDRTQLFMRLTINDNRTKIEDLITTYSFLNNYSESIEFEADTVDLLRHRINTIENLHYLSFQIKNPESKGVLVLKVLNKITGNDYYFDINVNPDANVMNSGIVIKTPDFNLPFFRNYIREDEPFQLVNLKTSDSLLTIYRYTSNFRIADPPYSSSTANVIQSLEVDSVLTAYSGETITVSQPGLYFAQYDTVTVNGLAFRVENGYFPKRATYDELIEAMTYFTTQIEMERITEAEDLKDSFDGYWLEITGSVDKAKRVIREYYRRIAKADEIFTTYKQGWKTDKGMIFTIFGPPDEVQRDGNREEWIYERSSDLPRVNFTFVKAKSIFTDDHYVLLRRKSYQQLWYQAIELWRKGRI